MLYLAEFVKPIVGKPSLQLLAKQQQQDSWQPVNEETIVLEGRSIPDISRFKDGSLVLAEIASNRQVSRLNDASRQLVTYLHNFSRLQDKARSQEEEIDTWKQSLTFQSQELNRREMELESQEEELQRLFEKYQTVEEDSKVLEGKKEEINTLETQLTEEKRLIGQERESLNRQRQELDAQLEEAKQSRLSDEEAEQLQTLIAQLQQDIQALEDPLAPLKPLQEQVAQQREIVTQSLTALTQELQEAQTEQADLDQAWQAFDQKRQSWLASQSERTSAEATLKVYEASNALRQDYLQVTLRQLQLQEDVSRRLFGLVSEYDFIEATGVEMPEAEPEMTTEQLVELVNQLRQEYEQRSVQVNQQLAEYEQQQQQLHELQEKLTTASADDRFDIEMDIDYAQSACSALEETLRPQQEYLERQQKELVLQESRLAQRQGHGSDVVMPKIDLGGILSRLEEQKALQNQQKTQQESAIQELTDSIQSAQSTLAGIDGSDWDPLTAEETELRTRLRSLSERLGSLQQKRDHLTQTQAQLEQWQAAVSQLESTLTIYAQSATSGQSHVESVSSIITNLTQPSDSTGDSSAGGAPANETAIVV